MSGNGFVVSSRRSKNEYKDSDQAKTAAQLEQSAEIEKLRTQAKNLQQKVSMLRAKNAALEEKESACDVGASKAQMEALSAEVEVLKSTNKRIKEFVPPDSVLSF